jgi:hypothetical protein
VLAVIMFLKGKVTVARVIKPKVTHLKENPK